MSKKRIKSKDCHYESFKINQKHHSLLVKRKFLLGQSIEYQVSEAMKVFFQKHAQELKGRKIEEFKKYIFKGRTFKFKLKLHQMLMLRRKLLGQSKDWQINEALREYLNRYSIDLLKKEKEMDIEIEKEEKATKKEITEMEKEITEMDIGTGSETTVLKKGNGRKKEEARGAENENTNKEQENKLGDTLSIPTIPAE